MKKSRKKRKLAREKLDRHLEAWSKIFGKRFTEMMKDAVCCVCGEKATGIGAGKKYCGAHFFTAFDEEHGRDIYPS